MEEGFMEKLNFYELLYQYRMDDEYAGRLMELQMKEHLEAWVIDRLKMTMHGSRLFYDDLYQEAVLGMYEAMETYREDKSASFVTYVKIIVENRLKNYTRMLLNKNIPLKKLLSIDEIRKNEEQNEMNFTLVAESGVYDPVYMLRLYESKEDLSVLIERLKKSERDVLFIWQEGYSYKDGSEKLGIKPREFEGRLARVRKKVKKIKNEDSRLKS